MLRKVVIDGGGFGSNFSCLHMEKCHKSTGLFPFDLLYGRDVRGPLHVDVSKETWEAGSRNDETRQF